MSKKHFTLLVIGVISGLLFSIGMCMCLITEWNSFVLGVVLTSVGGVSLIIMGVIAFIKKVKNKTQINWRLAGKISYGVISTLILGLGMSMILVLNMMVFGIIVGVIGIIMMLFLIPIKN